MKSDEDAEEPAVGAPFERRDMPLVEYERELARLLARRKRIDQRREAIQAQITMLRRTIADIERARKADEESKLSFPWQVKFLRGNPANSGRDIAMLVQYLTTPTTLAAIGREHGISGGRAAQIVATVVRRLRNPIYWMDGATAPYVRGAEEIRASAAAWLSALGRAEERHNHSSAKC